MKPTVGRIVHYWVVDPYGNVVPRAAIITHVWSDECVNLHVFGDGTFGGEDQKITSVVKTEANNPMSWSWPERV